MTAQMYRQMLAEEVEKLNHSLMEIQNQGWKPNCSYTLKLSLQAIKKLTLDIADTPLHMAWETLTQQFSFLGKENTPSPEALTHARNALQTLQEKLGSKTTFTENNVPPLRKLIVGLKDKALVKEIVHQVKFFNYTCVCCQTLDEVLAYAEKEDYHAILLDTDYCSSHDPLPLHAIAEKKPLIFISAKTDVATRLFAVHAGAKGYFVKPIEMIKLIEKIDEVIAPSNESLPYRVLIIEDSRTQSSIIRGYLEQAGMITEVLIDPFKVNEVLTEFQPDIILLDLYMPKCSGIDLAKVIRQQEPFVSIPIAYLSAEDNTTKQLRAMKEGADDFLTKPIAPHHLIAAVSTRAKRSRALRSQMSQDSLTNLLNHTRILEQLDLEIARCKRNHTTALSFAMIDIDHFKAVNDLYGHPTGDNVIRALARLLKQRLRKIDSVGRYGGEEFAIILPQTHMAAAFKKLDEMRKGFSKLSHRTMEGGEFSVTFSAGLAEFNEKINTVDKLVQAADKCLYLAKKQGRDRIIF